MQWVLLLGQKYVWRESCGWLIIVSVYKMEACHSVWWWSPWFSKCDCVSCWQGPKKLWMAWFGTISHYCCNKIMVGPYHSKSAELWDTLVCMPTLVELHPTVVVVHCAWLYIYCHVPVPPHKRWVADIQCSYSTWHMLYCMLLIEVDHIGVVGFYRLVSCFSVSITPLLIKYAYNEWVMLTPSTWSHALQQAVTWYALLCP